MNFTIFTLAFLSTIVASAPIYPEILAARDVYVPPITFPTAGAEWVIGSKQTITWDVSNPPTQITNPSGSIRLRKGGLTTSVVLAHGFDILDGKAEITVPSVAKGDDYVVVLFGDSGNFSPEFTITGRSA